VDIAESTRFDSTPTSEGKWQIQQPFTHLPSTSNSIVFPLNGRYTGTLLAALKVAVFVFGNSSPPLVAISLACEGITAFGLTSSNAAEMGKNG
jgi:hypothetical protein